MQKKDSSLIKINLSLVSSAAMSLRRILLGRSKNLSLSNAFHSRIMRHFSTIPIGREPSSLPCWALTKPLHPNYTPRCDDRPISLRFRVSSMIELSQLDKAAQTSRLAVSEEYKNLPYTVPLICNKIIGAMYRAKRYDDAIALFHYFFNVYGLDPNMVTFSHIIKVHCDENNVDDALRLYNHATTLFEPYSDTQMVLLKGFVNAGRIFDALGFVMTENLWDSEAYSYMIRAFLDLGNHDEAYELLDEIDEHIMLHYIYSRDYNRIRAVVEATFVDYWFKQGKDEKAMEIYSNITNIGELLLYPNTGNTLLETLFGNGKTREAWELFNKMITNSKTFDRETFRIVVKHCFELKEFEKAVETFKRPELRRSSQCYGNIIARFCALGMMSQAQGLFDEVWSDEFLCPDVPMFRSMINGYAKVGKVDDATETLKKMVDATILKVAVIQAH